MDSSMLAMFFLVCFTIQAAGSAKKYNQNLLERIDDMKAFKKLLRVRTNVLVIFAASEKAISAKMDMYSEVAEIMKGRALLIWINCGEDKKMCKKLKAFPATLILKHYKDGDYNKDYDRRDAVKSMVNFLDDPTGDEPWEEDPTAKDIIHVDTIQVLGKVIQKDGKKLPILLMFYASWCGFCKKLKPEFAAVASEMKGHTHLVGVNADKPEMGVVKQHYNISGYPTLLYFKKGSLGELTYQYNGEQKKDDIIAWLRDPKPSERPKPENQWADEESDVVHLTEENFDSFLAENPSVLVMFYAPWCGHCKKMKPEYTQAAAQMKEEGIAGVLAAVDATQARPLGERYGVKGFPTVKYFKDGNESYAFNGRDQDKIVEFMKDPQEPPPPPPSEPKWSEIESDVVHLTTESYQGFLKKRKHALVMLYAPWCGFCKKAKPEYMKAATKLRDNPKVAFTAIDCTEEQAVCKTLDVTGYPTFIHFNYGKNAERYNRGTQEADFVAFMSDPLNPVAPPAEQEEKLGAEWADIDGAENLHHLTADTFDDFLTQHDSVLVMFYAPWCGHCKKMKPDYALAATQLMEENIGGVLATIDGSADTGRPLMSRYEVKGFPTLKYFKDGKLETPYNGNRVRADLVAFMKNPVGTTTTTTTTTTPPPSAQPPTTTPPPPAQPTTPPPTPPPAPQQWAETATSITHLTDNTFPPKHTEQYTLVLFYMTGKCAECRRVQDALQGAALVGVKGATFAAVDCDRNKEACQKIDAASKPVLRLYHKGVVQQVHAITTTEGFLDFLNRVINPNVKVEL